MGTQTAEILSAIERLLRQVASDKSKLVSLTIYLAAIGDFDAMNTVYDGWVDQANPPARACVEARLAGSEFGVEVVAVALA